MNATVKVELQIACRSASIPAESAIRAWIEDAMQHSGKAGAEACGIVVRIVDERESRTLNRRFRHKDAPTNVLAFPAGESASAPGVLMESERHLGDLALCGPLVEDEARSQGKNPAAHWGHLLIHGTLHLLGFDHQSAGEAERMEQLETRILALRGIGDPYAPLSRKSATEIVKLFAGRDTRDKPW